MATVFEFDDRAQKLDPVQIIKLCIQQTVYEIIALNCSQLESGEDSTGSFLKSYDPKLRYYGKEYPEYRKQYYQVFKNELNPKPGLGNPDLFLTGEFYKGIGVVVTDTTYTVESNSEKAPRLELRYGSQIYGLTTENKTTYCSETLKPAIINNIRQQLAL